VRQPGTKNITRKIKRNYYYHYYYYYYYYYYYNYVLGPKRAQLCTLSSSLAFKAYAAYVEG